MCRGGRPIGRRLIAAKFAQGAAGALVLPAALAMLRGGYADADERARMFGVWAAWTGAASAAGPLMAGALVDRGPGARCLCRPAQPA
jgi:MFS family permease